MRGFIALICFAASLAAQADMLVTVDKNEIDEMDTIRVVVRITGTDETAGLDLAPLRQDFEMVDQPRVQSQFQSINGRVSAWVEHRITLRPLRTGALTIPALTFGSERSNPITVTVRPVPAAVKAEIDRLVYFEVTLDRDDVYVQAQAVLTRRLYYTAGVQIYGNLPGAPDLPNAVVLPLGEATSEATMVNGRRYGMLEQRYAIFPERSGTLEIPGFSVTSSVRLANRGRRGVRVHAEAKTLTVRPVPPDYPADAPWFPANAVSLSEHWQPEPLNVGAGDALTRHIEVRATGAVGSAIPPMRVAYPDTHFKAYPAPPDVRDDASGSSVIGSRTQQDDLIVTHGGVVVVPAVTLIWWDTSTDALQESTLPQRALRLLGPEPAAPAPPPPESTRETAEAPTDRTLQAPAQPVLGWWLIALLPLALLPVFWRRRKPRPIKPVKRAEQDIETAGTVGDVLQALTRFAAHRYGVPHAQALAEVRRRIDGAGERLDRMNATGYGSADRASLDFREEGRALLRAMRTDADRHHDSNALPPLYPVR